MAWHGPDGQQLYYEDTGRGDTVLLMPGWGGSIVEFSELRAELAGGVRVIAVDLPGSGRSQPQPRRYRPSYYLDDAQVLLGLLDELGVDAAHLAGFSDGGEEALLMAAYLAQAYGADGARIMTGSWAEAMRELIDAGGDISRSRAPSISCPALLVAGSGAPFCTPELVRDMADAIPRGSYLEVDGGHDLYQSHRRLVISTISGWLSDH